MARDLVKAGEVELLDVLFGSVPNTLSELIRTAFIPKDGHRFIVADFSAIEARVLAWLAGEEWVLEEFRGKGKIYEATAARMFHVPVKTIVREHENYAYRQKISANKAGKLVQEDTWGGKLSENVTQAIARDLLAFVMMNLEAAGYRIVFHVHDEVVLEMPIGQGTLEEACGIMGRIPDWADGLSLRADGYECEFYRED